jgi:hypothetical protein
MATSRTREVSVERLANRINASIVTLQIKILGMTRR